MDSHTRALVVLLAVLLAVSMPAAGLANDTEWSHTRHSNNVVDVETGAGLAISADSNDLQADDLQSGSQEWTFSLSGPDIKESDARDGRVVVVTDDGTDGDIYLLDASDGTTVNSFTGVKRYTATARTDDTSYAAGRDGVVGAYSGDALNGVGTDTPPSDAELLAASPNNVHVGTVDGAIEQHQVSSGSTGMIQQWRTNQTFDSLTGLAATSQVVVASGTDGNGNPTVAAFDPATGAILWTHGHHSSTPQDVGVADGHVASVQGDTTITARLSDGAQVASHTKHSGSLSAVAMSDQYIVSGDSSSSNELIAVEQPAALQNASPNYGRPGDTVTLSVDVQDPDTDDSHTVRFYNKSNGNEIGSETFSGDGTASVDWDHDEATPSEWNATLEDGNGNVVDSTGTIRINAPDRLEIREELPPHDLITTNMNVTVRFFSSGQIYERQATDGTVDLTGLPDEPYVATVRPPDGSNRTTRTIYVVDIYQRQTVYLLSTDDATTIESRFVLNDATGEYDPNSILYLEKAIVAEDGVLDWETVHADQFGAEGVTVTLEEGQRYRVRLRNSDGTEQVVGPYRSDTGETVQVRPGAPTIELGEPIDGWYANGSLDGQTLEYRYSDPSNLTTSVDVAVYERRNHSNFLQPNESYSDLGSVTKQTSLTQSESEKEWIVEITVNRDGQEYTKEVIVGNYRDLTPGPISREWRLIGAIMLLLLSAGAFSVLNVGVGAVVVSIEGAVLYFAGWLQGATSAAAVAIAMFIAAVVHIYKGSGP